MFPAIVISDTHLHERMPRMRIAEAEVLLRKLKILSVKRKCKTLIILGDLYDRNTLVSIKLIMQLAGFFQAFDKVVLIVGNHDTPIKGYEFSLLDIFKLAGATVISRETVIDGCLFLPYFAKPSPADEPYRMVFMHKDIVELNPYADVEWALKLDEMPNSNLLFNGHLHKNAEITKGEKRLVQVGSPYPCTWSDEYQHNRYAYIVRETGVYERIELNITADAGAEDAGNYAFTRERTEKREAQSPASITAVIEDIKQNTLRIDECLNVVSVDERVKRLIRSVVRNADSPELDGSKL